MTNLLTADCCDIDQTPTSGLIQGIDARMRVISGFAFALVAVALHSLNLLLIMLALATVLAALARLQPLPTLRRMLSLDAFMVPILLFLPFTHPGPAIATFGPLAVTAEGLHQAAQIILTANAVVLALLALVGTIEPASLGHALLGLRIPHKIARLLLLTVRYVGVLRSEYDRLRLAMRARAFRPAGNLHTWKSLGYLFGMLLVRSFERSERILEAMKCRGFTGRYFVNDTPPPTIRDWTFAACMTVMLLAIGACGVADAVIG